MTLRTRVEIFSVKGVSGIQMEMTSKLILLEATKKIVKHISISSDSETDVDSSSDKYIIAITYNEKIPENER